MTSNRTPKKHTEEEMDQIIAEYKADYPADFDSPAPDEIIARLTAERDAAILRYEQATAITPRSVFSEYISGITDDRVERFIRYGNNEEIKQMARDEQAKRAQFDALNEQEDANRAAIADENAQTRRPA